WWCWLGCGCCWFWWFCFCWFFRGSLAWVCASGWCCWLLWGLWLWGAVVVVCVACGVCWVWGVGGLGWWGGGVGGVVFCVRRVGVVFFVGFLFVFVVVCGFGHFFAFGLGGHFLVVLVGGRGVGGRMPLLLHAL
ncbi:hypothetical protein, partial [Pseudomonas syringae group genomosp. 7]|uniref:hypothetical protein n=1 Tax=Pseudomonas syringae group genomosp. 7 TaxID=251699 RepID=UPI00376F6B3D